MNSREHQVALARPALTPAVWEMIGAVSPTLHQARLFGVARPEQAAAILLKGFELGLSFTSSLELITVIQGKPTLSPRGALALILSSPLCTGLKIDPITDTKGAPTGCRVWMKRTNGFEHTVTFTLDDARRAQLIKADSGWEKYPLNMCQWRAVGFCADVVFGDVLGGLKRADELGADLTPGGDVVEAQWQAVTAPAPTPELPATTPELLPTVSLNDLVLRYGPEAIMAANGGRIPGNDDELAAVAETLGGNGA